ncbi:MAG: alpha/beta hydrolase [Sodaliphilus pleomorphus]|jgi:fermentation-respiration switch protein FrsA (DUF1100 family)|uniref:alpha/beta hydrolase n=1 Tax=Sodaliphilus pleomorphus TaxID=2606626 RepID=UPI0023F4FA10|nr:alpha/beta hydrolase [Sodaliphilus pleomorphus]MCI5979327.1 alpha/beta hydrolase [Muribaculaceae bacterium]MDY6253001.1 alpha/beta hydrolase [Bacteroidales bacterium]MCI6168461.1 alpha/beta hydrolase [Muribaculaceae bacterium]MDD6474946.1 alpha/beta hydrolase [Sodaliphilus pleomorphus]MDD7066095.1 alpha/beta hydrolase [Sodaliphilus pleomorphus]
MSRTKKIIAGVATGVVALVAADIVASLFLVNFALKPEHVSDRKALNTLLRRNPELRPWVDSLMASKHWHDTTAIISGQRQRCIFVTARQPSNKVAVLVHGYKNSGLQMLSQGAIYYNMGYNLVLPDLYAHGKSEGKEIQMGWNDRYYVMRWMAVANELFRGSHQQTQMVVHGVSMGAATTMAISGEKLPGYVKCLVEDCGYTSVHDEFAHELGDTALLGTKRPIPQFPILPTASLLCKWKYGWSFEEASMIDQVKKCKLPMLFIHGDNDDFVPSWMVKPLYQAKPQPKELYIAKGSKHAQSLIDHPQEYAARVKDFVEKYIH